MNLMLNLRARSRAPKNQQLQQKGRSLAQGVLWRLPVNRVVGVFHNLDVCDVIPVRYTHQGIADSVSFVCVPVMYRPVSTTAIGMDRSPAGVRKQGLMWEISVWPAMQAQHSTHEAACEACRLSIRPLVCELQQRSDHRDQHAQVDSCIRSRAGTQR